MNKNLLWIVVTLLVLGGLSYLLINKSANPAQPTPEVNQQAQPTPTPNIARTVTLSEQNNSGESGTATLTESNGKVRVVLDLTGAKRNVVQPAHIHVGACPTPGEVKYPLTSPVNGMSETILETTLEKLKSEQPLAINVHESSESANVYVACGDLAL